MASRQLVRHSPKALSHYRQQMSLSVATLAKKTGISEKKLQLAELEGYVLTIKQLERISDKLFIPLSYLTFDTIITRNLPSVIDFRNNKDDLSGEDEEQQYQYLKVAHEAYIDRQNLLDIYESLDDIPMKFGLSLSGKNAKKDAELIKMYLNLDEESFTESGSDYYKSWRTVVEKNDVLVLEKSNSSLKSEGMALYYDVLPIIIIMTSGQSPARRLFTLIHELVHLGLKQSALDGNLIHTRYEEELYCNKVAGYVLVPESTVKKLYNPILSISENVLAVRKITKASRPAVAIQFKQLGLITRRDLEEYIKSLEVKSEGNFGIPKKYTTYNNFGKIYLQQVFSAIWQEQLTINSAMELLRIPNRIEDLKYLEEKAFS